MTKGIIYLIQPAELVNTNKYKIGCSLTPTLDRCKKGYKKGSRYLSIMECYNPFELEKNIKNEFNKHFKLIAGNEFFEGDEYIMLDLFLDIVKNNRQSKEDILQIIPEKNDLITHFEYNPEYIITLDNSTYSIAKNFHLKYSKYFICSDVGNDIWWQFNNNKWSRINKSSLKIILSEDYLKEYQDNLDDLNIKKIKSFGLESEYYMIKKEEINKIIKLLKNNTFKNNVIEEIKGFFYEPSFITP